MAIVKAKVKTKVVPVIKPVINKPIETPAQKSARLLEASNKANIALGNVKKGEGEADSKQERALYAQAKLVADSAAKAVLLNRKKKSMVADGTVYSDTVKVHEYRTFPSVPNATKTFAIPENAKLINVCVVGQGGEGGPPSASSVDGVSGVATTMRKNGVLFASAGGGGGGQKEQIGSFSNPGSGGVANITGGSGVVYEVVTSGQAGFSATNSNGGSGGDDPVTCVFPGSPLSVTLATEDSVPVTITSGDGIFGSNATGANTFGAGGGGAGGFIKKTIQVIFGDSIDVTTTKTNQIQNGFDVTRSGSVHSMVY